MLITHIFLIKVWSLGEKKCSSFWHCCNYYNSVTEKVAADKLDMRQRCVGVDYRILFFELFPYPVKKGLLRNKTLSSFPTYGSVDFRRTESVILLRPASSKTFSYHSK